MVFSRRFATDPAEETPTPQMRLFSMLVIVPSLGTLFVGAEALRMPMQLTLLGPTLVLPTVLCTDPTVFPFLGRGVAKRQVLVE